MTTESFFSASWYRVAGLTPRLAGQVEISRHRYRGQGWYVVYDPASQRVHRFTPAAWLIIGRMNGARTVEALWTRAVEELEDDAPTQDDVVRLLSQLHAADLLRVEVEPDTEELLERFGKQRRGQIKQRLSNPMALRFPLFDPDRFLERTLPVGRLVFGWAGLALWLVVVTAGIVTAGMEWPELTNGLYDRVFSAQNLLVIWIAYPVIKALHELAHGYTAKMRGAPVHEFGIMLLVLFPVPYVDASAAAALPDKRHRALIGSAGILVELFLAAAAIIAWSLLEPGFLRTLALNVALIGGISTVLLNGNPLLRFDGYYVLTDLIEMPGLAQRSTKFWGRLVERFGFGAELDPAIETDWRERAWLAVYGPAAFVYRLFIILGIALIVGTFAFGLGLLLAVWAIFNALIWPLAKALYHVASAPRLAEKRKRAVGVTGAMLAGVTALLVMVPVPMWTNAEGIVWLPERSELRAGTDGFVAETLVAPGSAVTPGTPLIRLTEPVVDTRIALVEARVTGLERQYRAALSGDPALIDLVAERLEQERAALAREEEERARLVLRAGTGGTFVLPRAGDLEGRFLRRGEVVGHVVEPAPRTIRVVVRQDAIDLVRHRLRGVEVLLVSDPGAGLPATVVRQVPAAGDRLPNAAFATSGGGRALTDPSDPQGLTSFERYFQLDLLLAQDLPRDALGSRVLVRFEHDWMPVGLQIYRRLRLLVLSELDV